MNDSKSLRLPLDEFLLTAPEIKIISRAREELVVRCLEKFGVQYANKVKGEKNTLTQNERRYGLADAKLAKQSGYHVPALDGAPALTLSSTTEKLLRGDVKAYKGIRVPSDGCLGLARHKLQELEMYRAQEEAQRINLESYKKSQTDPSVIAVNKKWSECMEESRFEYPDPISAINSREFKKSRPSEREKNVALADVICKREANFIGVWSSIESSYQRTLIRKSLETLKEGQRLKQVTIDISESIKSGK